MVYPDTFEGFQVDGAETWTTFTKREVRSLRINFLADINMTVVYTKAIWRLRR